MTRLPSRRFTLKAKPNFLGKIKIKTLSSADILAQGAYKAIRTKRVGSIANCVYPNKKHFDLDLLS